MLLAVQRSMESSGAIGREPSQSNASPPEASESASSSEPMLAAYRRMIAAFNANDLSVVREVVADDLVYTLPGKSALAGCTVGVQPHLAMLKRARELSLGTLRLQPEALAVDGEHLFVWGTIRAERGDKRLEAKHCVVYRFFEGKIVEGRTIPTDLYAFDAFWTDARTLEE
jgi:ketosteroid isomerase-like protein